MSEITPQLLLRAYAAGIFPMAERRDSEELFWVDPQERGVFPLGGFHISRSLRRRIRQAPFQIAVNKDFEGVLTGCADRPETWINEKIFALYIQLHRAGFAHSLETWEGDTLVGGVYGVTLGGAFFGESMFSHRRDASKIALAYLMDRLIQGGFRLFDTQFLTDHLASLGAIEITRKQYHARLKEALQVRADFLSPGPPPNPQLLLQRSNQTS
ncbi:leucyl/phenylalanyl-tRNA--protein transferase [Aliiruegeria sabulilitoris]|uniref:leucyl/phenylalanyl-tRNA--protein transferase n=1 Tax=Aliiruegeria sabulilitoris TaxID=1510458 RepID=UPI0009E70DCC|nr:leucyl/phenylalanyl-tRNA--protein transferase [Aliiruegeria sabulilitoris]NDR55770.1 leucyl/phenylalanyl-tRNA--protein transferase [Pseudoruegeria sp. M32A2M]